jgi:CRP/FNR family transcriptional regulator, cyclic AMP receptor protein
VRPEPDRVRAIPLFDDLSEEELGTLASLFTVEEVSDSRRLTPEGASGYTFYVIESGTGDVVRSGERIAQLGAGDYFGEMALMGDGRRVADVIATSPMVVFAMFGTAFREMEAAFPEIASKVRATLEERLPAS